MNWLVSPHTRLFGFPRTRRAMNRPARRRNRSRKPAIEILEDRFAPSVTMVKDISSYTRSSYPQNLTDVNGTLFFTAVDNSGNRELFKTNGTPAGTSELTFPARLSNLGNLFNLGGKLFFNATDSVLGGNGILWTSDGTVAGTHPFLASGTDVALYNTNSTDMALVGNKLYFEAYDTGNAKFDLWTSDGTSAGTHPIQAGTTTGPTGSTMQNFTAVGSTLFFQSYDSGTGNHTLWMSNGTSAGTVQVSELTSDAAVNFTAVGSTLYFELLDRTVSPNLYALWKSDGTTTSKVADIGTTNTAFNSLTAFGGKLWFQVNDTTDAPNTGWALWSSDGTAGGTGPFKFNGGTTPVQTISTSPQIVFNGALYFQGWNAADLYSVWKTDGNSATSATAPLQASGATPYNYDPEVFAVVGTELFFEADDLSDNLDNILWKSDGTAAGTVAVRNDPQAPQGIGDYSVIVASGGKAFFTAYSHDANSQSPYGYELWASDGTAANTVMVSDINTTTSGSGPSNLTAVGSEVFFQATDNTGRNLLYQSDGTAANTVPVQTSANVLPTGVNYLTAVSNTLFFEAGGPDGNELWTSGTGTDSASPFQHGGSQEIAGNPIDLVNDNGMLYFFANDSAHSKEALWKSDGTQAGTVPLVDLPSSNGLGQLTAAGGNLFFQEYDSTNSTDALWEYNGSTASQVADISSSGFSNTTAVGGSVFFQAYDSSAKQYALWTSNGTTTTQLTHFANGNGLGSQIAFAGKFFYTTYNPAGGNWSLYMSDGTVAGTQLYLTGAGNPVDMLGGNTASFTILGGNLYFQDLDAGGRHLLATTDGTPGGFATVQAGSTGLVAYDPQYIVNDNGTLVFEANDPAHGWELWQSDGTAAGTLLTADIVPGSGSSNPVYLTVAGNQVFFQADDGFHGPELWSATIGATAVTAGLAGPTDGVTMQQRDFVLTAGDSNSADNAAGFSFAINWGDGTSETLIGQSGLTADQQYAAAGNFVISVTATNLADNQTSAAATQTENITVTEIQGGNLALGGLAGNDAFVITKGTKANTYTVKVNSTTLVGNLTPATGDEIFLYGGNGTNSYTVSDTGTTADTFTLGTGYVTFIKATFVPQTPGAWSINGNNGNDVYTIVGTANASIVGGTGTNTYNVSTGGSLNGTLSAGSGTHNTLSYAKYATGGVVVDLPLGLATAIDSGVAGGISGIRNVTGSQNGGDILVGDANPNILKANKGRNILIGGPGGGDTLYSGGADILIAGTTSYDSNIAALQFILGEWKAATAYTTRINTIENSLTDPLNATTVSDSGAGDQADTLNGKGAATSDWFFVHTSGGTEPNDIVNGMGSGDTVTGI
jgi:ELWxxDGT repeat protein